jgi:ech hydrogenase subunit E
MGYVEAIEHIMGVEIPDRAKYLRTIWMELSRMHSHLLWLGLLADAFGYESLFYQCWRIREQILDMIEESTGGRVIFSVNKVGGVMKDMDSAMLSRFLDVLTDVEGQIRTIRKVFLQDRSVQMRLRGVGVLTRQMAHDLGCAGPFGRASGIATDMRIRGYGAYGDLDFEPIISTEGDSYARCQCRIDELFQSIDLIRQAVGKIPAGDLSVPVKGNPDGEFFMRIEQPRGEAVYYVKGSGKPNLNRLRIRTPTFANLPGLCETLKGADYADVPILVLTIDPCISCTER